MRLMRPALASAAARRLHSRAAAAHDVDAVLQLAFDFQAFGIHVRPLQRRFELRALLEELARRAPRAVLEIGTANGGTLLAFTRLAAPDAHIISIDLPAGPFGGGYPRWKLPLYRSFAAPRQRLDLLRADSHRPETLAQVRSLLDERPLDFLFIDADHTCDGVREDYEAYGPLLRPGGLIAFHDILPPAPPFRQAGEDATNELPGEVWRLWAQLRDRLPSREIIDPSGSGCMGIGLITV